MLEYLEMTGVGPAEQMRVGFSPRLNILTGDNGLGKTFVLDVAWWALTGSWARLSALPHKMAQAGITCAFRVDAWLGRALQTVYDWGRMEWPALDIRPVPDAVVIYAQSDGIVCAWDPARNYREGAADAGARSLPSFSFRPQAVFDGLTLGGHQVCNGLIDDWVDWEARRPYLFRKLAAAIEE